MQIGQDDLDKNFNVVGQGPKSDLVVTPLSSKYYRTYKCRAENFLGVVYQDIVLEEAHEPTMLQQAILNKYTATTMQFRFVPPINNGGVPIESYAVEYKEIGQSWDIARRRVWPASEFS